MGEQLTFLDFFAGIGGARRGMELAGHKCVGFCEWDKWARASYISMHCMTEEERQELSKLKLSDRQKEIWKNEEQYRHGEWCANDIRTVDARNIPKADCWCFGAPCQSFSIAGKRAGLDGESGLIREIFRILGEIEEESRPEWLVYENVKGMFSSNRGFDYLAILLSMDELGYDIEWQVFNSKDWGVPQNRERVYTVGHLRAKGSRKIFPIGTADGENSVHVSIIGHRDGYRKNLQTFTYDGITENLDTGGGGGREHHVALPMFGIDYNIGGEERPLANTIKARYDAGVTNFKQDGTAVCIPIIAGYKDGISEADISPTLMARDYKGINNQPMAGAAIPISCIDPQGRLNKEVNPSETAPTLRAQTHGNNPMVCIPVLTPDRGVKRQNGRRFKNDGEPSFTLTSLDRHGVGFEVRPMKMAGHECSDGGDIANCLNVNDQRKIFGAKQDRTMVGVEIRNGLQEHQQWQSDVAPTLTAAMGMSGGYTPIITVPIVKINEEQLDKEHPGIYVQLSEDCTVYAVWYEKYECYIAIRKLLPLECFRLQGWEDKYFYRAELVNSDTQLYKQAGNGITVTVMWEVAKRLVEDSKITESTPIITYVDNPVDSVDKG